MIAKQIKLNYALWKAAENGNVAALQEAINAGANLERKHGTYGETALISTAKNAHFNCVKALVEAGANINASTSAGWTALHNASCNNDLTCLTYLLEKGANPNTREKKGNTPLLTAAKFGYTDIIEPLLKHEADPNAQNNLGNTPLLRAVLHNRTETIKELLKHDILDTSIYNKDGQTALSAAREKGNEKLISLLENHIEAKKPAVPLTPKHKAQNDSSYHFVTPQIVRRYIGHDSLIGDISTLFNFEAQNVTAVIGTAATPAVHFNTYPQHSSTAKEEITAAYEWLKQHPKGAPRAPFKAAVRLLPQKQKR